MSLVFLCAFVTRTRDLANETIFHYGANMGKLVPFFFLNIIDMIPFVVAVTTITYFGLDRMKLTNKV